MRTVWEQSVLNEPNYYRCHPTVLQAKNNDGTMYDNYKF